MKRFRHCEEELPWVAVPDIPELREYLDQNVEKKGLHKDGEWRCRSWAGFIEMYNAMLVQANLSKYQLELTPAGEQVRVLVHAQPQRVSFSMQLNFGLPFSQYGSGAHLDLLLKSDPDNMRGPGTEQASLMRTIRNQVAAIVSDAGISFPNQSAARDAVSLGALSVSYAVNQAFETTRKPRLVAKDCWVLLVKTAPLMVLRKLREAAGDDTAEAALKVIEVLQGVCSELIKDIVATHAQHIEANEDAWLMCAGCVTKMDWQFGPELVELAVTFLGEIFDNLSNDKISWLPYGNPEYSHEENALPAFNAGNGCVSILIEARRTSQLAVVVEEIALLETDEDMKAAYALSTGQDQSQLRPAVLQHLYLSQDADDKLDALWDYHPHKWLDSIEDSWKGTYFHISKQVNEDGSFYLVAQEQTTDVGW
eukprot:TRINITY_DN5656_c0_g1_i1.p1 TRINITY_DN5656_c0_g1~~TRINITY_DN5656_c0_g1_i1.p1  ORF type:complete len:423 (+),score=105.26 TRINITY_DN5656_c0_g1_i1:660-1928(+)